MFTPAPTLCVPSASVIVGGSYIGLEFAQMYRRFGAAVTVLGIMAAPIMIKAGYDARMSAGAIAAGGTLGILVPPSVMLIVM